MFNGQSHPNDPPGLTVFDLASLIGLAFAGGLFLAMLLFA